jgi:hypothetical protein
VESDGRSARSGDVTSPLELTLPGNGPLAAPFILDSVQLTAGSIAQATGVDPATIQNAVNRDADGDGVEAVFGLPVPQALNQLEQITDQPSQPISIDT